MASVGTIVEFTIYPQRTFRTQALNMADGLQQKTNRYLERFPNANLYFRVKVIYFIIIHSFHIYIYIFFYNSSDLQLRYAVCPTAINRDMIRCNAVQA